MVLRGWAVLYIVERVASIDISAGTSLGSLAATMWQTLFYIKPYPVELTHHAVLPFNVCRLCPSGGELLAQALTTSSSLERLVLQRKEVGGQGLAKLVDVLRARTNTTGAPKVFARQVRGCMSWCYSL